MTQTHVFLGGHDLEMDAIGRLVSTRPDVVIFDRLLTWGAKASEYANEIRNAMQLSFRIVLVELIDDLPGEWDRTQWVLVDHHGPRAGMNSPTSIEQIFELFHFDRKYWTRDLKLISANDRGHIPAMLELGASLDELREIRQRDRSTQGITAEEEAAGVEACKVREQYHDGRLTVVSLSHHRTATVTDTLDEQLGGPGYKNLLILSPQQTTFFGSGRCIDALRLAYPDGWFGGELPERGYWGVGRTIARSDLIALLELHL